MAIKDEMPTKEQLLDILFKSIKDVIETITLPTGKSLVPSLIFASIITVISVVATIFKWPLRFLGVDWRGAMLATLTLGVLLFIERRGYVEVSRLYRAAKTRAADLAERAKRPGAHEPDAGGINAGDTEP